MATAELNPHLGSEVAAEGIQVSTWSWMAAIATLFSWARLFSWQIGPPPPQTFFGIFLLPRGCCCKIKKVDLSYILTPLGSAPFAIPHSTPHHQTRLATMLPGDIADLTFWGAACLLEEM